MCKPAAKRSWLLPGRVCTLIRKDRSRRAAEFARAADAEAEITRRWRERPDSSGGACAGNEAEARRSSLA